MDKTRQRSRLVEEGILKSWWVILFFFCVFFAYDRATARRHKEEVRLESKLADLKLQKARALETQEDLELQIASQNDDAFIELTLMKGLGLVPEGESKVLFVTEKQ